MSAAMAQKKEGLNGMSENEKLEQAADQAADKPANCLLYTSDAADEG